MFAFSRKPIIFTTIKFPDHFSIDTLASKPIYTVKRYGTGLKRHSFGMAF